MAALQFRKKCGTWGWTRLLPARPATGSGDLRFCAFSASRWSEMVTPRLTSPGIEASHSPVREHRIDAEDDPGTIDAMF